MTPAVEVDDTKYVMIPERLLYDPEICADAVRVYGVLRRHGDSPTDCYPSHRRIAERIGRAPASVPAWINALERAGWVSKVPRWKDEERTEPDSNGYVVRGVPVREQGVPASQRGGVPAQEQGPSPLESAPKESPVNESQETRETTASADAAALAIPDEVKSLGITWQPSAVALATGHLSDAVTLSEVFAESLRRQGCRVGDPRSRGWVEPIEEMLRIDHRTREQIAWVIEMLATNETSEVFNFWRGNILSPNKLRMKWDQMAMKYRAEQRRPDRNAAVLGKVDTAEMEQAFAENRRRDEEHRQRTAAAVARAWEEG